MIRRNTLLQSNVTEKPLRSPIFAAHRSAPSTGDPQCTESPINGITSKPSRKSRFQQPVSITVVIFYWRILLISESMGHHDSEIMDDRSID
jgi:hypothetical protein